MEKKLFRLDFQFASQEQAIGFLVEQVLELHAKVDVIGRMLFELFEDPAAQKQRFDQLYEDQKLIYSHSFEEHFPAKRASEDS